MIMAIQIIISLNIMTDSAGLAINGIPFSINFADTSVEVHIGEEGTNVDNNDGEGKTGNVVDIYPDVIYADTGDEIRITISVDPEDSINTACFDDLSWDKQMLNLKYVSRGDLFSERFIWIDNIDEYEFTWGSRYPTTEKGDFATFVFEVIGEGGGTPGGSTECPYELNDFTRITGEVEPDCHLIGSLNDFVELFDDDITIKLKVKKQGGVTEVINEEVDGGFNVNEQILWYQIKSEAMTLVDASPGDDVEMEIEVEVEVAELFGIEGVNFAMVVLAVAGILLIGLFITRKRWME